MPLVTREANRGVVFRQALEPGNSLDGDLWSDTTANLLKLNVSGTFDDVGATSFSSAATVSYSETIGDYIQPDAATATSAAPGGTPVTTVNGESGGTVNGTDVQIFCGKLTGLAVGGVIDSVEVNCTTTNSANWRASYYNDSSGVPGTLLEDIGEVGALATGFNSATADGTQVVPSDGIIWVCIQASTTGAVFQSSSGNDSFFDNNSYGAFPATFVNDGVHREPDAKITVSPGFPASNAVDDNTGTRWQSNAETNPAIFVDEGETNNFVGIALFWNANTTETSFTIRVSTDNTFSAAEDVRTILTSAMTNGAFNFIRFNVAVGQFMQIRGASGSSLVLAINEIKSLTKTDNQIIADLGILEISPTDTTLALDGT